VIRIEGMAERLTALPATEPVPARLDDGRAGGPGRSFIADVERRKRNTSILNLGLIAKGLRLSLSRLLSKL
jgi:hypothetical protein